jgi:hypothetical protein
MPIATAPPNPAFDMAVVSAAQKASAKNNIGLVTSIDASAGAKVMFLITDGVRTAPMFLKRLVLANDKSQNSFVGGPGGPGESNENFRPSHFNLPVDYVVQD